MPSPTPYSGDPTAAQAPDGVAPSIGGTCVVDLPVGGMARNASSIYQPLKTPADWLTAAMKAAQRVSGDFFFEDDFNGSALTTGKWNADPGVTLNDGSDSGTYFGSMFLSPTPNASKSVETPHGGFALGSLDFRFRGRIRVPSMGGATSVVHLGLQDSAGIFKAGFTAKNGAANWQASLNGTDHDTGVAYGGTYQTVEVKRTSGVFYFLIDGTQVYTETVALTTLTNISWLVQAWTSGATTSYLDYVKMWAGRAGGL